MSQSSLINRANTIEKRRVAIFLLIPKLSDLCNTNTLVCLPATPFWQAGEEIIKYKQ